MKHCKWCNPIKQHRSMERNNGIVVQMQTESRIRSEEMTWIRWMTSYSSLIIGPEHDLTPSNPAATRILYPQCHGLWVQGKQHLKLDKPCKHTPVHHHTLLCLWINIYPPADIFPSTDPGKANKNTFQERNAPIKLWKHHFGLICERLKCFKHAFLAIRTLCEHYWK